LTFVIRRKSGVPRLVAFNSSFANVTPQFSVYVTFDGRRMLLAFLCRCVFEKFQYCNLKEGTLSCANEDIWAWEERSNRRDKKIACWDE
jgi:hypothetical protein